MKTKPIAFLASLFLLALPARNLAQVTTFTYQGHLTDAGSGANGIYDLQFSLFDVDSGGVALDGPLATNGVPVSNGLFTVTLDFGSDEFKGIPIWLEIGVKTNGAGAFTTLSPRTEITATPYAIYSGTAELAEGVPNNSIGSAQVIDNSLTANDLAASSVGTSEIAASAVGTSEITDNSVASVDITDGTITSTDIADGTLTTSDLNLASVDGRYVLKAGDTMTGPLTTTKLTATAGVATSSITNNGGLLSIKSLTDIELTIDNGGGAAAAFEIFNGAGSHLFLLGETGNARTYGNHIVDGSLGVGTLTPSDSLHVFNSGNEGDIMVENTFPFITLNQSGTNNNAGLLFADANGNSGWLYYRGSDQALTMGSTAGGGTPNTLVLQRDGNAGIGTATAFTKLTVNGTIGFESPTTPAMYVYESGTANADKRLIVHSPGFDEYGLYYVDAGDQFAMKSSAGDTTPSLVVDLDSNWVTIATDTPKPGYELSVNGQVVCEELLVEDSANWPDYVFKDDYTLRSLAEVEAHIKEKKHLPGIPTAEDVKRDGLPIGEMQKRMMEKIEELTLYVIDQNKRLAAQEQKIVELEAQLSK